MNLLLAAYGIALNRFDREHGRTALCAAASQGRVACVARLVEENTAYHAAAAVAAGEAACPCLSALCPKSHNRASKYDIQPIPYRVLESGKARSKRRPRGQGSPSGKGSRRGKGNPREHIHTEADHGGGGDGNGDGDGDGDTNANANEMTAATSASKQAADRPPLDVNLSNKLGRTPLAAAAAAGHAGCVDRLLRDPAVIVDAVATPIDPRERQRELEMEAEAALKLTETRAEALERKWRDKGKVSAPPVSAPPAPPISPLLAACMSIVSSFAGLGSDGDGQAAGCGFGEDEDEGKVGVSASDGGSEGAARRRRGEGQSPRVPVRPTSPMDLADSLAEGNRSAYFDDAMMFEDGGGGSGGGDASAYVGVGDSFGDENKEETEMIEEKLSNSVNGAGGSAGAGRSAVATGEDDDDGNDDNDVNDDDGEYDDEAEEEEEEYVVVEGEPREVEDPVRCVVLLLRSERIPPESLAQDVAWLKRFMPTDRELTRARNGQAVDQRSGVRHTAVVDQLTAQTKAVSRLVPVLEAQVRGQRRWCAYCFKLVPGRDLELCDRCKIVGYCDENCRHLHWIADRLSHADECVMALAREPPPKHSKKSFDYSLKAWACCGCPDKTSTRCFALDESEAERQEDERRGRGSGEWESRGGGKEGRGGGQRK